MINSLRLVDFKNFADETLHLGPFTIIVGANASGKSNIRDAFRFLHGIGRGYTLAEIMGGKYGEGGHREWIPIRGAPNEVARFKEVYPYQFSTLGLQLELDVGGEAAFYSIEVGFNPSHGFVVLNEGLRTGSKTVYETVDHQGVTSPGAEQYHWVRRTGTDDSGDQVGGHDRSRPILTQLFPDGLAGGVLGVLGRMRFLELNAERMREPSLPRSRLGDSGQNLSAELEAICAYPERRNLLESWLNELTPMDVSGFEFPRDPSGKVHLRILERGGSKISADSASDGTLRFLAMLAVLLGPKPTGLYFFEEIDNGIHPNRLWLLLELIETQTARHGIQVVTTTHSPGLLSWVRDETFENTSIVYRGEHRSDGIIRPVADLYDLRELRKSHTLGALHTEGWLENAMAMKDGDADADGGERRGETVEGRP